MVWVALPPSLYLALGCAEPAPAAGCVTRVTPSSAVQFARPFSISVVEGNSTVWFSRLPFRSGSSKLMHITSMVHAVETTTLRRRAVGVPQTDAKPWATSAGSRDRRHRHPRGPHHPHRGPVANMTVESDAARRGWPKPGDVLRFLDSLAVDAPSVINKKKMNQMGDPLRGLPLLFLPGDSSLRNQCYKGRLIWKL